MALSTILYNATLRVWNLRLLFVETIVDIVYWAWPFGLLPSQYFEFLEDCTGVEIHMLFGLGFILLHHGLLYVWIRLFSVHLFISRSVFQ
jgi:hypothetical protein